MIEPQPALGPSAGSSTHQSILASASSLGLRPIWRPPFEAPEWLRVVGLGPPKNDRPTGCAATFHIWYMRRDVETRLDYDANFQILWLGPTNTMCREEENVSKPPHTERPTKTRRTTANTKHGGKTKPPNTPRRNTKHVPQHAPNRVGKRNRRTRREWQETNAKHEPTFRKIGTAASQIFN